MRSANTRCAAGLLTAVAALLLAIASVSSATASGQQGTSSPEHTSVRSGPPTTTGSDRASGSQSDTQSDSRAEGRSASQSGGESASQAGSQSGSESGSEGTDHVTSGTAGTSGTVDEPQPVSNADSNAGGANGQCPGGPYCSTRDGSPSLNGNGGGLSTGKPCAGCVGKADNKNPAGQFPDGSDHNAGYECDRNHGIARTNPAHTGCRSGTEQPPPSECVENPATPGPDCAPLPPGTCVPVPPATSCSQVSPPGAPPMTHEVPRGGPPPTLVSVSPPRAPASLTPRGTTPSTLPNTGAGASLLAAALGGLALTGAGLLLLRRRSV